MDITFYLLLQEFLFFSFYCILLFVFISWFIFCYKITEKNPQLSNIFNNYFNTPFPSLIISGIFSVQSTIVDGTKPPSPPSITTSTLS